MLRKVAVQIIASLLTVSGLRLVALLLVMGLCVLAQAKLKPYTRSTLNRLEMLSLGSLLLSLVLEVAVLAAESSRRTFVSWWLWACWRGRGQSPRQQRQKCAGSGAGQQEANFHGPAAQATADFESDRTAVCTRVA